MLPSLDGDRKARVVQFLHESGLIAKNCPIVVMSGANLSWAVLIGADLEGAAGITGEQLEQQASSLAGATMPNGQKYEEWLKDRERREEV